MTHRITDIVVAIGAVVNATVDLLPPKWAAWVHKSRKAIVTLAGGALAFGTALGPVVPPQWAPVVAGVVVALTAVVTYWTPNAEQSP